VKIVRRFTKFFCRCRGTEGEFCCCWRVCSKHKHANSKPNSDAHKWSERSDEANLL